MMRSNVFSDASPRLDISPKEHRTRSKHTGARTHPANARTEVPRKSHLLQVQSESRIPLPMLRHGLRGNFLCQA
jgi:hypothetical protein